MRGCGSQIFAHHVPVSAQTPHAFLRDLHGSRNFNEAISTSDIFTLIFDKNFMPGEGNCARFSHLPRHRLTQASTVPHSDFLAKPFGFVRTPTSSSLFSLSLIFSRQLSRSPFLRSPQMLLELHVGCKDSSVIGVTLC